MKLFFCIFFPPLGVFLCGKPFQVILSVILCLCGLFPGIIHGIIIYMISENDRKNKHYFKMKNRND